MKRRDWWLVKSTLPERMLYAYLMLTADDNPKFDLTERQIHVLVGLYVLSPRFLSPAQYSDEILVKHPPIKQKDTGLIVEEEALSRFKQEESTWLQVLESTGGSIVVVS